MSFHRIAIIMPCWTGGVFLVIYKKFGAFLVLSLKNSSTYRVRFKIQIMDLIARKSHFYRKSGFPKKIADFQKWKVKVLKKSGDFP